LGLAVAAAIGQTDCVAVRGNSALRRVNGGCRRCMATLLVRPWVGIAHGRPVRALLIGLAAVPEKRRNFEQWVK